MRTHTSKYSNVFISVIELWLIPHISLQTDKKPLQGNERILLGAGPYLLCSAQSVAT